MTLAFAWAAYPFTQYIVELELERRDHAGAPHLGLLARLVRRRRAALFVALAGLGEVRAPSSSCRSGPPIPTDWAAGASRRLVLFGSGLLLGTALAFWILLLEPDPLHAARVFWDRTFGWQLSPLVAVLDLGLGRVPRLPRPRRRSRARSRSCSSSAAVALYFVPRRKSPLQLAALSGALLIGFELVLTHWFYLYIPWFFPFVAIALLAPAAASQAADGA